MSFQEKAQAHISLIDKELSKYEVLNNLEKQTSIPKTYAFLGAVATYFFFIFFNIGGQLLTNVAGFVIPGYYSLEALFSMGKSDDTQWLTYWVVFAFFTVFESLVNAVYWFPFYFTFKFIFVLWLALPATGGAHIVFRSFIQPVFARYFSGPGATAANLRSKIDDKSLSPRNICFDTLVLRRKPKVPWDAPLNLMPLPKLTPLQSRLAASLFGSMMLLLLYLLLTAPNFAYATEVDSTRPEDHNHERLMDFPLLDDYHELESREVVYEANFFGVDSMILPRNTAPTALLNNRVEATNVQLGQSFYYVFANASVWGEKSPATPGLPSEIILDNRRLRRSVKGVSEEGADADEGSELRKRQTTVENYRTVYITVTTCDQPTSNTTTDPAPQLQLYVSQFANNTNPGPGKPSALQDLVQLEGGYALHEVNATGDVYISIYAQNATAYNENVYSAHIAASIDAPYHKYWNSSDPNLFLVDSDDYSALLFTDPFITNSTNTTLFEEWMDQPPPYVIFASDANDTLTVGLERSYCGLKRKSSIQASLPGQTAGTIVTGMTAVGNQTLPKQSFFVNGLGAGKTYKVSLAMDGNSTASGTGVVGGGGQVFAQTSFDMLSGGNCAVIHKLSFCDQTAYSVPSNPNVFPNMSALAAFYDNATQASFANFEKVLAQIPCETTSTAQYSLARNCADCREAYKTWLCAVSIPRCTDFTKEKDWLQARAMGQPFPNGTLLPEADRALANITAGVNASRNSRIDDLLVPGPYKEVLPCDELCFNLVRSCPASMGFGCPQFGDIGFNESYGVKPMFPGDASGRISNITCNSPGTIYYLSAGRQGLSSMVFTIASAMVAGILFI
ncbi:uncharacterized protein L3040_004376 [Drepanopeziza brunnea f. sp. 'multigermtubi']|nr:hypothetical protein L3040_004376 [Drepanopeziza brunnea f. sp. 'multigermtubi']